MYQRFDRTTLRALYLALDKRLGHAPTARDLKTAHAMEPERYPAFTTWAKYWRLSDLKAEAELLRTNPKRVRYCAECGVRFVATAVNAKFCSRTHAYRHRDRERAKRREAADLCVKCGKRPATPSPTPELQDDPLAPSRYCDECRRYWRERKRRRKQSPGH